MENKTWQIRNHQDEYLEIIIPNNIQMKQNGRVFYLHESKYLTCYCHLQNPRCLLLDIAEYTSLKKYLLSHHISQHILKEWIAELLNVFFDHRQDVCLKELSYIFIDEENGELHFACLPIQADGVLTETDFFQTLMELFETMDFDGDEEWLSRLYMLVRQKPLRVGALKKFLNEKNKHRHFSFLFKKKYDETEDFFKSFEVHENMASYTPQENKTTLLQDDFKTQVLMVGFQCGYLEDEHGKQILISQSPWMIGRQEGCQQQLNFPEISKLHAQIMIENGHCYLMDLGSTNGSVYNQRRLLKEEKVELENGAVLNFAGHIFIYHE